MNNDEIESIIKELESAGIDIDEQMDNLNYIASDEYLYWETAPYLKKLRNSRIITTLVVLTCVGLMIYKYFF